MRNPEPGQTECCLQLYSIKSIICWEHCPQTCLQAGCNFQCMPATDPTVVRVLKGAYNKRPPLPRYSTTWEVSKVTSHVAAMGGNESLSLKLLSLKLVILLALIRPTRSNDLSNLSLKTMKVLLDVVQFKPVCLSKQSRPSRPLKPFTFPSSILITGYAQRRPFKHI